MTMRRWTHGDDEYGPCDDGEWVRFTDALAFAAQEYDRALEDAARVADAKEDKYWRPLQVTRSDLEVAVDEGKRDCAEEIAATIRAMKKGNTDA
jgi:hypothetical protein